MVEPYFQDRREAGRYLATFLTHYANQPDVLVLGLPRGGVPVAFEVAQALNVPLDVLIVRKLGVPGQEELAMGAIASGGVRILNPELLRELDIPREDIETITGQETLELKRRESLFRDDLPPLEVKGKTVILVDDGLATGSTMYAAVLALKEQEPSKLVMAVPISARETCRAFAAHVDEVVCPVTPEPFGAVGAWYRDFSQTTDEEVRTLLARSARQINHS